jgi:signal transduction histidine kinase
VRRRLIASYLLIAVVILAALGVPLGRIFASREEAQMVALLRNDAAVVASRVEDSLERGVAPPQESMAQLPANTDDRLHPRVLVVDRAGGVVADSGGADTLGAGFANRPEIGQALAGTVVSGTRYSTTLRADLMYVAIPVASGGVIHGAVRITAPRAELDRRIRAAWIGLAGVAGIVVISVAVVGSLLARLVAGPVRTLERAAAGIAGGDLSARADTTSGAPELRQLSARFNDMAAQNQRTLDSQRRFVADASHQLRTPLAVLRLQLENLEATAASELQSDLASARAEVGRLSRIVESLLSLSRVDARRPELVTRDVAAVCAERLAIWGPVAGESDVELVSRLEPGEVLVEPEALEQMLDNLLDNALGVAPAGSTLLVTSRIDADMAEISVLDEGPGLNDAALERAFDRFWRSPEAEPGGSGLGLSIVQQLAERCGGSVHLTRREPTGLDVTIRLPLARSGAPS